MKKIALFYFLVGLLLGHYARSQNSLSIVGIDFPSEVTMGSFVSVSVQVQNTSSYYQSGELNIYLHNDSIGADHVSQMPMLNNVMQYFGGGQIRTYFFNMPINQSNFRLGGNTIVIWPSFELPGLPTNGVEINVLVKEESGMGFEKRAEQSPNIYPNPAQHFINIDGFKSSEKVTVRIYNLQGAELLVKNLVLDLKNIINIAELNNGTYFVTFETEKGIRSSKYFTVHK
jgi:hypothetical protein